MKSTHVQSIDYVEQEHVQDQPQLSIPNFIDASNDNEQPIIKEELGKIRHHARPKVKELDSARPFNQLYVNSQFSSVRLLRIWLRTQGLQAVVRAAYPAAAGIRCPLRRYLMASVKVLIEEDKTIFGFLLDSYRIMLNRELGQRLTIKFVGKFQGIELLAGRH